MEAANEMYGQNIRLSMAHNARLYQNGYALIETLGEVDHFRVLTVYLLTKPQYAFVPGMFSNGTYGSG
jgi:hypothetical protein